MSVCLASLLCVVLLVIRVASQRPHIIFILADDLGWNDVGFHGSNQIPTPNIDALAYGGVILNNYYVLPVCTPSRSALMTGRHPIHNGMQHHVLFCNEPWGLPLGEKLLPQYLEDLGYVTRHVGKWHLGHFRANYTPTYRGFQSHFGYWGGHQDYYDHTAQDSLRYWGYDMRQGMAVNFTSYGHYTTDLFTAEATRLIEQHDPSRPLFLYLAHLATHSANPYRPLQAPSSVVNRFKYIEDPQRRIFAGMLNELDASVGAVVAALEKKHMLENSIIIFSTDNGGPAAGFNSNAASNWPLRGVKDTLWEGGVRGAALVWSPQIKHPRRVATHLMHIEDWLPTLMSAINASLPPHLQLDGHNVWDSISNGGPVPSDEVLVNIDDIRNFSAVRKGDWKLINGRTWDGNWDSWYGPSGRDHSYHYNVSLVYSSPTGKALSKTQATLPPQNTLLEIRREATVTCGNVTHKACKGSCLFNVMQDPCELHDLSDSHPDQVSALQALIRRYNKTAVPPNNKPADPRSNPKYWGYIWTNWMDYIMQYTSS